MRHAVRTLIFGLLGLCWVTVAYGQSYPVTASLQLTPPYSVKLPDYVAPGSNRMAVNVYLGDLSRPQLDTRLRIRIEGQGIRLETRAEYRPTMPLSLTGGVAQRLIASDLAPYFRPENLTFQGITATQLQRNGGALPEGLYRFTVEVLEYQRGVRISNQATAMAWLILNDPPLINRPRPNEKLRPQDPQFVTFQWTPRHTGSPNSAFSTDYYFELVEVWPSSRNPNDAILTSVPLYTTTTNQTSLQYGPSEPALMPGRRYAYRVRAISRVGVEDVDLFKNEGYSEVHTFVYGDACTLPEDIKGEVLTAGSAKFTWTANLNHTDFTVRYRPANANNGTWYNEQVLFEEANLDGLQSNTPYMVELQANCGFYHSDWSDRFTITTQQLPQQLYSCGAGLDTIPFDNTERLPSLKVGDTIFAGDFEVEVLEASGSNGSFSGSGRVMIPYFDNLQASVTYQGITVNTDYRMIGGAINVTGLAADVLPDEITDFLDELDETLASVDAVLDDVAAGLDIADEVLDQLEIVANDIYDDGPFTEEEAADLEGLTVQEYQQIANDKLEQVIGALATSGGADIEDYGQAAHNLAQAVAVNQMANQLSNITKNADSVGEIAVVFEPGAGYGWDEKQYEAHRLHYNIMYDADSTLYPVPWMATKASEQAILYAKLATGTSVTADQVRFLVGEQALQANQGSDGRWLIAPPALEAQGTAMVRAIHAESGQTLGRVDLTAYTPQERTVHIIPVGSAVYASLSRTQIENYLNEEYKAVFTNWTVDLQTDALEVAGYEGTLQDDVPDGKRYSMAMENIIEAYKDLDTAYNKDHFYVFLVDKSATGKAGYMPRRLRYGFVYLGETSNVQRTLAHELGHGAFRLQHSWEHYPSLKGTATANLMDYNGGEELRKFQWDLIQDPPRVIGLLEDQEESSYSEYQIRIGRNVVPGYFADYINQSKTSPISFVSATGYIFTLPGTAKDITFNSNGLLAAFTVQAGDGSWVRYISTRYKTDNKFAGFRRDLRTDVGTDNVFFDEVSFGNNGNKLRVYLGFKETGEDSDSSCGIHLYDSEYPVNVSVASFDGGIKAPFSSSGYIGSLMAPANTGNSENPIFGSKIRKISIDLIESPEACELCDVGKVFADKFSNAVTSEAEFQALLQFAGKVCDYPDRNVFYAFAAEMDQRFEQHQAGGMFGKWASDQARDQAIRDAFWERPDAWQLYYKQFALFLATFEKYKLEIQAGTLTNDNVRAFVNAISPEFLELYTVEEKFKIIENLMPYNGNEARLLAQMNRQYNQYGYNYTTGNNTTAGQNEESYYSETTVGDSEENVIIKVLQSVTTSADAAKMLEYIRLKGFITKLTHHLDDPAFDIFWGHRNYTGLSKQFQRLMLLKLNINDHKAYYSQSAGQVPTYIWNNDNLFFPKNQAGIVSYTDVTVFNKDRIRIEYEVAENCEIVPDYWNMILNSASATVYLPEIRQSCDFNAGTPQELNFFDPIVISVQGDFKGILPNDIANSPDLFQGTITYAGFLDYLYSKHSTARNLRIADVTVTGISLAFGVGELAILLRSGAAAGRLAIVSWEIGSDVIDLVTKTQAFDDWCKNNAGECSAFKKATMVNQLAQLAQLGKAGFDMAKSFGAWSTAHHTHSAIVSGRLADDAVDLTTDLKRNLEALENTPHGESFVDVVVHGNGDKFVIDGKEVGAKELGAILGETNKPVRLLSCSSLASAEEFSSIIKQEVVATDGLVRIHPDGGISTVPRLEGGDVTWYKLNNGSRVSITPPTPPSISNSSSFLALGTVPPKPNLENWVDGLGSVSDAFRKSLKDNLRVLTEDELTKFIGDFGTNLTDLAKFNEISYVNAWRALKDQPSVIRTTISDLQIIVQYMARPPNRTHLQVASEIPEGTVLIKQEWLGMRKLDGFLSQSPNINSATLPQGYSTYTNSSGNKIIRRTDASDPYTPQLQVDQTTGAITHFSGSLRISKPGKLANNLLSRLGLSRIPDNHQAHHLVPDNVVRRHWFYENAIGSGWYDIDRGANGVFLASEPQFYTNLSRNNPTHRGPHPNYDAAVTNKINEILQRKNVTQANVTNLSQSQVDEILKEAEDAVFEIMRDWDKTTVPAGQERKLND